MVISTKKILGIIHLWLGLVSGLVIFIVAITGAIYVFSDDIIQITESSFTKVAPQHSSPLLPSQLTAIAENERKRFLGDKQVPGWNWATLYLFNDSEKAVRFSSRHYENPNQFVDIFINPYTGDVLKTRDTYANPFWDIVVDLHTSLMMGDVGVLIVEWGTLIFLVMLISGIILWWPKNKAAAKQRFWFRWKQGLKWKRKNYDLHNILGFYASWIVLFMAITGLGWSFTWFRNAIYFTLNSEIQVEQNFRLHPAASDTAFDKMLIDKIYHLVQQMEPDAKRISLNFAVKQGQPFNVYTQQTDTWAPGNYYDFDPVNGRLISKKLYEDMSAGEKYDQMSGDIHYGWIFGWPSKIVTFLACIIAASLPITGFYIWYGKRRKAKGSRKIRTI